MRNFQDNYLTFYFHIFIALIIISCCSLTANSQVVVSGTILNQTNKKAIPNASVFFNNATIGTTTDHDGKFILSNIKRGKYELIISALGFSTFHQILSVEDLPIDISNIELSAKPIILKEVRVTNLNSIWQRNFKWFRASFLGTTSIANDCKIINPEILEMTYKSKVDSLLVSTDDFLLIENNALGYRVKYLVDEFVRCDSGRKVHYEGYVLFEEMKGSPTQQKRWVKKRQEVYEGSSMHFLRSAIYNRLEEEGFRVFQYAIYSNLDRPSDSIIMSKIQRFRNKIKSKNSKYRDSLKVWTKKWEAPKIFHALLNFPLNADEIVRRTSKREIYAFGCENDGLYIIYNKNRHFPSKGDLDFLTSAFNLNSTLVNFNSLFVFFDDNGWIINPEAMSVTGVWGKNRVAGLLPMDYDPSR